MAEEESNGHGSPSRLDRIERAIEAVIDGHRRLVPLHIQLRNTQAAMTAAVGSRGARPHSDPRFQILWESQLRIVATLASIQKLLERPDQC